MQRVISTGLLTGRVLRVCAVALLVLYLLLVLVQVGGPGIEWWTPLPILGAVSPFLTTPRFREAREAEGVAYETVLLGRALAGILLGLPLQVVVLVAFLPSLDFGVGLFVAILGLTLFSLVHTASTVALMVMIAWRPGLHDVFK